MQLAMLPPSTIVSGLWKLTSEARTSPMPLAGQPDLAAGRGCPAETRRTTSAACAASAALRSRSAAAMAAPEATASTQPVLPQWQSTSSCPGTPDVADVAGRAGAPRCSDAVGDDAAADAGADLDVQQVRGWPGGGVYSPRAIMLTSLSTRTGAA